MEFLGVELPISNSMYSSSCCFFSVKVLLEQHCLTKLVKTMGSLLYDPLLFSRHVQWFIHGRGHVVVEVLVRRGRKPYGESKPR